MGRGHRDKITLNRISDLQIKELIFLLLLLLSFNKIYLESENGGVGVGMKERKL